MTKHQVAVMIREFRDCNRRHILDHDDPLVASESWGRIQAYCRVLEWMTGRHEEHQQDVVINAMKRSHR